MSTLKVYTIGMSGDKRRQKTQGEVNSGFPPLLGDRPRLLILGSFPGEASLVAGEYYAHPRNSFWEMMEAVCGAGRQLVYAERCAKLIAAGVAVWDVLQCCRRRGSADSRIETQGLCPNPVAGLIAAQPLRAIAFNGQPAARLFRRHVLPQMTVPCPPLLVLPSTSPANARMSMAEKQRHWRQLQALLAKT